MSDKSQIRVRLLALGLPEVVTRIFDGNSGYPELSYRCQSPFSCLAADSGFPKDLVPLWECGVLVTAFDPSTGEFSKLSLEEPGVPWFAVFNFSEVVADLFIDLWEAEVSDETLKELAQSFGFSHLDKLLVALEEGSSGAYDEWRSQLRAQCRR